MLSTTSRIPRLKVGQRLPDACSELEPPDAASDADVAGQAWLTNGRRPHRLGLVVRAQPLRGGLGSGSDG